MVSRDILLVGNLLYGTVRVPGLVVDVLAVYLPSQWTCSASAGFVCIPGDCLRLFGAVNVHFVFRFELLGFAVRFLGLIPGSIGRSFHAGGEIWHLGKGRWVGSYRYPFCEVGSGSVAVCLVYEVESHGRLRLDWCVDVHVASLSRQGLHVCHIGIISPQGQFVGLS